MIYHDGRGLKCVLFPTFWQFFMLPSGLLSNGPNGRRSEVQGGAGRGELREIFTDTSVPDLRLL